MPTGRWRRGPALGRAGLEAQAGTLPRCPAGRAHARGLPRSPSASRISSCSTSRPTISTATAAAPPSPSWRTGAIVVSHDRELLEAMDATVELTSSLAPRDTAATGAITASARRSSWPPRGTTWRLRSGSRRRGAQGAGNSPGTRKDLAGKRKRAKGDMPRIMPTP